jgi:hypothetical protein
MEKNPKEQLYAINKMLRDVALSGIKEPTIHTGSHNHSRNTIVA